MIDVAKITSRMDQRQLLTFNALSQKYKLRYLMSFLGIKDDDVSPHRYIFSRSGEFGNPKIYETKGQILNAWIYKQRKLYDASRDKSPTDSNNDWIGVEIECFLLKNDFNPETSDCECKCTCTCSGECSVGNCRCECNGDCRDNCECSSEEDFIPSVTRQLNKAKIKNIQVVHDGSLDADDDDRFGVEIKVLFRMSDYSNLEKLCAWLKDNDANVNTSCGLHVHLDARDKQDLILKEKDCNISFSKGNFAFNLERSLKYLTAMLPASRQKNTYCRYGISFEDRYHMINCEALEKHGTIEVRAHSGTVSLTKILNWVKILNAVKFADSVNVKSFDTWVSSIALSQELTDYAKERISKFTPSTLTNESSSLNMKETAENEESEAA